MAHENITDAFQVPKFHRKSGFQKFGVLMDYPKGRKRLFYVKQLSRRSTR